LISQPASVSGFALPLLSHALDQQRRFEGAEAAAKRGRGSATRVSGEMAGCG